MEINQIGKKISEKRKSKSLTQQQLGDLLGVTGKTVSRWENGNYCPDISLLVPICQILDISLNELLLGQKETKMETKKAEEKIEKNDELIEDYSASVKAFTTRKLIAHGVALTIGLLWGLCYYYAQTIVYLSDTVKYQVLHQIGSVFSSYFGFVLYPLIVVKLSTDQYKAMMNTTVLMIVLVATEYIAMLTGVNVVDAYFMNNTLIYTVVVIFLALLIKRFERIEKYKYIVLVLLVIVAIVDVVYYQGLFINNPTYKIMVSLVYALEIIVGWFVFKLK